MKIGKEIIRILKNVLTSSTSSVVNGPPDLDFPKSILEGTSPSQYVRALHAIEGSRVLGSKLENLVDGFQRLRTNGLNNHPFWSEEKQ